MQPNKIIAGINQDVWDFPDLILLNRFAQALEEQKARYPIHRTLRFAARTEKFRRIQFGRPVPSVSGRLQ
jgi:hypothetical protein